jgi:glycosyltransferase involved in cell wall biosynthesis
MIGLVASIIRILRGAPIAYWAMDLNPDQIIALGKVKATDLSARLLEAVNRIILRQSSLVIALDRFMADRLASREGAGRPLGKTPLRQRMLVMPPWPHEDHIAAPGDGEDPAPLPASDNPFRARHGLAGEFVVMYSGNHSPSNPLQTLLEAAERLKGRPGLRFLFVGGGIGKRGVEAFIRDRGLTNAMSLPYQPLSELRHSLSAADVHVVSLGADMVGIIHPCKVYGAMAAGRPVLFLGPRPSHVSDLLEGHRIGWHVRHGDVDGAVRAIEQAMATPADERAEMGRRAREAMTRSLTQRALCGRLCDGLERALGLSPQAPE